MREIEWCQTLAIVRDRNKFIDGVCVSSILGLSMFRVNAGLCLLYRVCSQMQSLLLRQQR